jgi:hypothetical protein
MSMAHYVGLDLGQAQDYTALAILQRPWVSPRAPRSERRPPYALRYLQRYPLGTPYPVIVQSVRKLLQRPLLRGCVLIVDQTGVGRAVVDMLSDGLRDQVTCTFQPLTITAGQQVAFTETGSVNVPKKILIGTLQVLLQTRRLQIARSLPAAATLVKELENFRVKVSATAHESFEAWRSSQHDDLVLAVALAAWLGEFALPPLEDPPPPEAHTVLYV